MNSMVYFYSKFTEEFLLLGAAGIFALLSVYCYHWVIQKRRLGLAHSQIPSAVVKSYLNQLINEAEFVRKQLFGMNNDGATAAMPFHGLNATATAAPVAATDPSKSAISPDLLARLGSLESQLREKESLVVNINVEKAKLLEEVETLRANSGGTAYVEANQKSLTDKIKNLEARLEEYSLFEEDLANLKRLQQENAQLKKKLSEAPAAAAPAPQVTERKPLAAVPDVEPIIEPAPAPEAAKQKHALDQDAIDALLEGKPATPPVTPVAAAPVAPPVAEPVIEPQPKLQAVAEPAPSADQFEKLVDSVETSLDAAPAAEPEPLKAVAGDPVPLPTNNEPSLANKTDEELLKEFENLLNS